MFWKRSTGRRSALLTAVTASCVLVLSGTARLPAQAPAPVRTPLHKFKAMDADGHNILINRPGMVTLLLGTSEDSQDGARLAGEAVYPFQGRPDFQLMVVVDLRNSMASWVPSVVLSRMRSNLDEEGVALKPYFLKNGNKSNPRSSSFVIADFKGTICPQLGWPDNSDDLRGILFGGDGREIKRWDKIEDMQGLQNDVRGAIATLDQNEATKAAAASKSQGTKLVQPPKRPPPLPPMTPAKTN